MKKKLFVLGVIILIIAALTGVGSRIKIRHLSRFLPRQNQVAEISLKRPKNARQNNHVPVRIPAYNQNVLSPYSPKDYRLINNPKVGKVVFSDDPFPSTFKYISGHGNPKTKFHGIFNLENNDAENPQSVGSDHHYFYLMCTYLDRPNYGYVLKIKKSSYSRQQQSFLKVEKGPSFYTGHGQSLALNPKTRQLWFVTHPEIKAQMQRLNQHTLFPDKTVNFKLNDNLKMGEQLAFDNNGNFYFDTYSPGGKIAPSGTVKLYRGLMNGKEVRISLLMKGIRHNPGKPEQGLAYNRKNNNLYLISNGQIMRFSLSDFPSLTRNDVRNVTTNVNHEFEGLTFDQKGHGFLLVNNPKQLMRLNKPNF